jgi:nicotinamide-nucleotide amidase
MIGEIVSIGDELLIGQVVNTNAAWISSRLNDVGIRVARITAVADTHEAILKILDEATQRAGIIIMTGGLGPTRDDITKHTLCDYFNTRLVYDDAVAKHIQELFAHRGLDWNELNRQQAMVPEHCTVLPNSQGTAPGMWFEKKDRIFISLPGVPFEMMTLITDEVVPRIKSRFPELSRLVHRTVYTQGIPESILAQRIETWEDSLPPNIKLAYLPRAGMVRLRLSGSALPEEELNAMMDEALARLERLIPGELFGEREDNLEVVIGQLLAAKRMTLSTAESCTGGYIAHMITSVAGSSEYFMGSVIAYSNDIKERLLTVPHEILVAHGAVSEPVVRAMAEGVSRQLGTDYAIATSGIAGPGGGTEDKPVGTTWIAVKTPAQTVARKFLFGKSRRRNIERAALTALNMLRKELIS